MIALKIFLVALLAQQCFAQLQCAGKRIIAEQNAIGTITNPSYPDYDLVNIEQTPLCFWEIEAPLGYVVETVLNDYSVEGVVFQYSEYDPSAEYAIACDGPTDVLDGNSDTELDNNACFSALAKRERASTGRFATLIIDISDDSTNLKFSLDYSIVPITVKPGFCSCEIQQAKLAALTERVASLEGRLDEP